MVLFDSTDSGYNDNLNDEIMLACSNDVLADYERSHDLDRIKSLWQAVVLQAISDAKSNSSKKKERIERHKAINWFSTADEDFVFVCQMAGLNPAFVSRQGRKYAYKSRSLKKRSKLLKNIGKKRNSLKNIAVLEAM